MQSDSPLVATLVQTRPPRAIRADALGVSQAAMLAGAPVAAILLDLAAEVAAPRDLLLGIAALFGALALAALAARPLAAPLAPRSPVPRCCWNGGATSRPS